MKFFESKSRFDRLKKEETKVLNEAEEQIETQRKKELSVPGLLPDTEYRLTPQRHEFPFGASLDGRLLVLDKETLINRHPGRVVEIEEKFQIHGPAREHYIRTFDAYFNAATEENLFKLFSTNQEKTPDYSLTDRLLAFLRQRPEVLAK